MDRSVTVSTTSRSSRTFCGPTLVSISRPTIREMTSAIVVSAVVTVSMYLPSRITVIRSEIARSSSIRCEM